MGKSQREHGTLDPMPRTLTEEEEESIMVSRLFSLLSLSLSLSLSSRLLSIYLTVSLARYQKGKWI